MSIPLTSTDPSDIANAARCFSCVIPPGDQIVLRTYLLNQITQIAGPPCVTPSAPIRVTIAHSPPVTTSTVTIAWSNHNTGSFVTGFQVFWGTTSGGPYTNSSGVLPPTPMQYTVTGLVNGTTYFFVVQAVAFAGCVSANSNEVSATTGGTSVNGLLEMLTHYYQFQEAASPFADSGSNPTSLSATNAGQDFSQVAGHVQAFAAHYSGTNGINSITTGGGASFDFTGDGTGNLSMSFLCWFNFNSVQVNAFPNPMFGIVGPAAASECYILRRTAANTVQWTVIGFNGLSSNSVTIAGVSDNNWHMAVCGLNFGTGNIFLSIDNGAFQTAAQATMNSINSQPFMCFNWNAGTNVESTGSLSDVGIWTGRVLTAANVTALWNSGNGLPFSQFTN